MKQTLEEEVHHLQAPGRLPLVVAQKVGFSKIVTLSQAIIIKVNSSRKYRMMSISCQGRAGHLMAKKAKRP